MKPAFAAITTILLKFSIFLVQYIYIHNAPHPLLKCQLTDVPHITGFTQYLLSILQ